VMWPTPTQQDSRIGPDNVGGREHRATRGSVALADVVHNAQGSGEASPSDAVNRVPRLKALGNAIVPAVAHIFALAIYEQLVAMEGDVEVAA